MTKVQNNNYNDDDCHNILSFATTCTLIARPLMTFSLMQIVITLIELMIEKMMVMKIIKIMRVRSRR